MAVVTMKEMLESGVHFGHQTRRWNPKMKRFILTERNGLYIIDLHQTLTYVDQAYEFIAFLQTPEVSAALAEGSSYNPVITGADALLSDVAKKNFQEAFPGDALKNLWPWPAEPTWYAEIRSQYADKFKAA